MTSETKLTRSSFTDPDDKERNAILLLLFHHGTAFRSSSGSGKGTVNSSRQATRESKMTGPGAADGE